MTMSDRLAVMRHGKIEQIGPPEEVYETPATEFVAGFLGASNMLDGEIKETDNGRTTIALSTGGTSSPPTPSGVPPGISRGEGRAFGRRRSRSCRTTGDAAADRNTVTGLLRMSTYIGVNYQYKVEGPGGTSSRSTCRTSAREDRQPHRDSGSAWSGCPSTPSSSSLRRHPSPRRKKKHERAQDDLPERPARSCADSRCGGCRAATCSGPRASARVRCRWRPSSPRAAGRAAAAGGGGRRQQRPRAAVIDWNAAPNELVELRELAAVHRQGEGRTAR